MPGQHNKNTQNDSPQKPSVGSLQNEINDLKSKMNGVIRENKDLVKANNLLAKRVDELESYQITSMNVNEKLRNHIDSLDQYGRRANLVIKHVPVPDDENIKDLEGTMRDFLQKELGIENVSKEIDKIHRIGKPKSFSGVKQQNVIIRFRSHAARYKAYKNRQKSNKIKVVPNLTKHRENTLFEAKSVVESIEEIKFAYSDVHGDLRVLFKDKMEDEHGHLRESHVFYSISDLNKTLVRLGLIEKSVDHHDS